MPNQHHIKTNHFPKAYFTHKPDRDATIYAASNATCLSESFEMKMLKIGCMICYDMIIEMDDTNFLQGSYRFKTIKIFSTSLIGNKDDGMTGMRLISIILIFFRNLYTSLRSFRTLLTAYIYTYCKGVFFCEQARNICSYSRRYGKAHNIKSRNGISALATKVWQQFHLKQAYDP